MTDIMNVTFVMLRSLNKRAAADATDSCETSAFSVHVHACQIALLVSREAAKHHNCQRHWYVLIRAVILSQRACTCSGQQLL